MFYVILLITPYQEWNQVCVMMILFKFIFFYLDYPNGDDVIYSDLSNETELFSGQGHPQYDVYRSMRDHVLKKTKNTDQTFIWQGYFPMTNKLWLHYLMSRLSIILSSSKSQFNDAMDILTNATTTLKRITTSLKRIFYQDQNSLFNWYVENEFYLNSY